MPRTAPACIKTRRCSPAGRCRRTSPGRTPGLRNPARTRCRSRSADRISLPLRSRAGTHPRTHPSRTPCRCSRAGSKRCQSRPRPPHSTDPDRRHAGRRTGRPHTSAPIRTSRTSRRSRLRRRRGLRTAARNRNRTRSNCPLQAGMSSSPDARPRRSTPPSIRGHSGGNSHDPSKTDNRTKTKALMSDHPSYHSFLYRHAEHLNCHGPQFSPCGVSCMPRSLPSPRRRIWPAPGYIQERRGTMTVGLTEGHVSAVFEATLNNAEWSSRYPPCARVYALLKPSAPRSEQLQFRPWALQPRKRFVFLLQPRARRWSFSQHCAGGAPPVSGSFEAGRSRKGRNFTPMAVWHSACFGAWAGGTIRAV